MRNTLDNYFIFCFILLICHVFETETFDNKLQCQENQVEITLPRKKKNFLENFPNYNEKIKEISQRELSRFEGQVYLDYTGSGVYQTSQLQEIFEELNTHAYGNAHSRNPSSDLTDSRLKEARKLLLEYFNAPKNTYTVIFTSGATGSLKLVGEDFPWTSKSKYYYLRINHNSVLGIREYAANKEAKFKALSENEVNKILNERILKYGNDSPLLEDSAPYCLFVFPAKDNFAGIFYPLEWIEKIQKYGLSDDCNWKVLLDAAAYVPTSSLDLSKSPADFVAVSFYKMFGYPTGLGLLLLKTSNSAIINKIYWGGGSVVAAACDSRWCKKKENPIMRFEDGTISFLAIATLKFGLNKLKEIGIDKIHRHVAALTRYMAQELDKLVHSNFTPVIVRYGREKDYPTGGIINFNILKPDNTYYQYFQVEAQAAHNNIHLRTGCFCNPGACQDYLKLTIDEMKTASRERTSCSDPFTSNKKPVGSIRLSMGYLTTFEDVETFLNFLRKTYIR